VFCLANEIHSLRGVRERDESVVVALVGVAGVVTGTLRTLRRERASAARLGCH
jgi:hypothetical protein